MSCEQERTCLLYLWGEMDAEQSQAFAAHLKDCGSCRAEVGRLRPLAESMRKIEPPELPGQMAEQVRRRLSQETAARRMGWLGRRRTLAVAATVLLAVGMTILWRISLVGLEGTEDPSEKLAQSTDAELTDEDYAEALALTYLEDGQTGDAGLDESEDSLAGQINAVAGEIEYLLQEVERELGINQSESEDDNESGWRRPSTEDVGRKT